MRGLKVDFNGPINMGHKCVVSPPSLSFTKDQLIITVGKEHCQLRVLRNEMTWWNRNAA